MKNKIIANINYTDNKIKADVTKGSDIVKLYKAKGIELDNDRIEILKKGNATSNGVPFIVLEPTDSDEVDYIEVIGNEEVEEIAETTETDKALEDAKVEENASNEKQEAAVQEKLPVNQTGEEETFTEKVEEAPEKPKRKKTSKE